MLPHLQIIGDTISNEKFGFDNEGRFIVSRNFVIKIHNAHLFTLPAKIRAILEDSRVPKYGASFFAGTPPVGFTNPFANTFNVSPERDGDNSLYRLDVSYGYRDASSPTHRDDRPGEEDKPDEDRERFPWEQDADVSIDFGNGREVVPEGAMYGGCLSLQEVLAERGTATAIPPTPPPFRPFMNTAGDPLKDPPTKTIRSGTVNISFNRVRGNPWTVENFLETYMFKINQLPFYIRVRDMELSLPAGTVQVVGYKESPASYVESSPWHPGESHPFGKRINGRLLVNTSKSQLTASRFHSYLQVTIALEYREDGFVHYILNQGMRERGTSTWRFLLNGEPLYTQTTLNEQLQPIQTPDKQNITEPWKLDKEGKAMPWNSLPEEAYFLKYIYYAPVPFNFIEQIPWEFNDEETTP